jgi:uncharacterized protein (TIGR03118 family)
VEGCLCTQGFRDGVVLVRPFAEVPGCQAEEISQQVKGELSMKSIARIAVSTLLHLASGLACFCQHYVQTNLVSDSEGAARAADSQLVNARGLSRGPGSAWWVADEGTGLITLYNGAGTKQSLIVTIPPADPTKTPAGSPTGTVFNGSSTDFLLGANVPATFLFCTADGTIAGWNADVAVAQGATPPSTHAVTVVKMTDGSVYTGLTIASVEDKAYLYAANFTQGRVDVFDSAFKPVVFSRGYFGPEDSGAKGSFSQNPFVDDSLPKPYVPFSVKTIGNDVVVTFVVHQEGSMVETDGPGLGFVDIFSSNGRLLRRLEHGPWLNAPWGVALAPLDFGRFSHDLLVAQWAGGGDTESSGFIAAYDLATGKLDGLLEDAAGQPLAINGIWAIGPGNVSPGNDDPGAAPAAQLYFTAGPNQGKAGLFGYLTAVTAELTDGNGQ